jgi:cation transport regulator
MPYAKVSEIPEKVRGKLPSHAQEIYRSAFNNACKQYESEEKRKTGSGQEQTAHKVAWAAVKQKYRKDRTSGQWVEKAPS